MPTDVAGFASRSVTPTLPPSATAMPLAFRRRFPRLLRRFVLLLANSFEIHGRFGQPHAKIFHGVDHDSRNRQIPKPFVVRRNQVGMCLVLVLAKTSS